MLRRYRLVTVRGIGTYTRELLRALLALDSDNDYLLVVHGGETSSAAIWRSAACRRASRCCHCLPPLGRFTGFASHQAALPLLLRQQRLIFSTFPVLWRRLACPAFLAGLQPLVVTLHDFLPLRDAGAFQRQGHQSHLVRAPDGCRYGRPV